MAGCETGEECICIGRVVVVMAWTGIESLSRTRREFV